MTPKPQLSKSRHGVYYLRYRSKSSESRVSLKTRDPDTASLALALARGMMQNMVKINYDNIRAWTLKADGNKLEIETEDNDQDRESALKALALLVNQRQPPEKLNPKIFGPSTTITISAAIQEYEKHLEKSSLALKTRRMTLSTLNSLIGFIGSDFDMSLIKNEIVESKWMEPRLEVVSETTVKRDLTFIKGFVKWAADPKRNYSPAPLTLSLEAKGENWEYYNVEDLKLIFEQLPLRADKLWQLWVPIIGLYTGARLSEICSLGTESFFVKNGIDAFHLKGTKTVVSDRIIPVHSDLIALGLLEMVNRVKSTKGKKLFLLPVSAQNGAGAAASKWYTNFKNQIGIDDPLKVFHSFRPTIVDHLKQTSVPFESRCQYVGHDEGGGVHNKIYGRNELSLNVLKTQVTDKIDWKTYCGWEPDLKVLRKRADNLLEIYMI